MRTQSLDTSPAFEQIQIARLRAFSVAKKFASTRSWTQSITSANFHSSSGFSDKRQEKDQAATFVAREYGEQLASLFLQAIEQRPEWSLQTPDIQEALLPLLDVAELLAVPALLVGSVASSIYGFPRSVQDVDIVVDFSNEHRAFLLEHLAHNYVFDPNAVSMALHHHTTFSVLHISRLIKIDIFFPSTVFDKTLWERRQAQELIEGQAPLFVASAEDVILLTLLQYKTQEATADDRWNDILGMLKVQALTVDCAYLERQATAMGIETLLSQALIDAGIRDDMPFTR